MTETRNLSRFASKANAAFNSITANTTAIIDVAATFFTSPVTITESYTIPANFNAMSPGPITVANTVTVTVPNGSTWTIV
jgi:hypothetical protein